MTDLDIYLHRTLRSGRISEILEAAEAFYHRRAADLPPETKAALLCSAMCITRQNLDAVISGHPEVIRTVKGHAFEVVFDAMMAANGVECIEVGGDTDVDRIINGHTLQLKTPYVKGCAPGIVSYKTHKTHGAKSLSESVDYYHTVQTFADYLVGLVSYRPFTVLIVPKAALPRVPSHPHHIQSPLWLPTDDPATVDRYDALGVSRRMHFPGDTLSPIEGECLPTSAALFRLRSDYILRAIFIGDNFRIWDMNMRGFLREHVLRQYLTAAGIRAYPSGAAGKARADKSDLALKAGDGGYVRFQVKGLTWSKTALRGDKTTVDCETQLSRGHVNDHPTQSRLYHETDFDALIVAVDPAYTNTLSHECFDRPDYQWRFYCLPMSILRRHKIYTHRIASHQKLNWRDLQAYRVDSAWLAQWLPELNT